MKIRRGTSADTEPLYPLYKILRPQDSASQQDFARLLAAVLEEQTELWVAEGEKSPVGFLTLRIGTTLHGRQFLSPPESTQPLTYFHRTGPIGHVLGAYDEPWRNVGIIGLGTGTLACYAKEGQRMTFYDIDPVVRKISSAAPI